MDKIQFDFEFWVERREAARKVQYMATRAEEKAKGNPQYPTVCRYWLESHCAAGDRCFYSHVYSLDRVPLCAYVDEPACAEGAACKFRHYRKPGERDAAVRSDPLRTMNLDTTM